MQRSTTGQGTYYGAQVEGKSNSECRGPEYRGDGHHSRRGARSSSNSSDSAKSGSGHSPNRGSPVPGYRKSRRIDSSEAMGVKKESQTQFYKVDERELAKFRFFNGLQELSIARAMREMLVAVAGRDFRGLMTDRAFLLEFGVPKDSVEKVMQIYRSCYGNTQVKDKGRENSGHQTNRLKKGEKSRHTSPRRDSSRKDHREDRHSDRERATRNLRNQPSPQEKSRGYGQQRKTDRSSRERDLPMSMNATLKNLSYDGSTEWETFIHRFKLVADQMGLDDCEKAEFLVSTLQGDAFKAIMYAQRAKGELGFHEICSRLESRYEGDFSTPAAAWMKLDQAFQQRNESLFQWSDRLNRIGDSIFRLDVGGRNSIETRLVSKFCFAAWDREAGVKTMEQGPPKTLEEAVESMRWFQHVQGAASNIGAERPRAHVRGWLPDRESWDRHNRRGDMDSRYERYRESTRPAQQYSTYQSRSQDFGRYEGSPRADDFRDRERVRDSRDNYQVRAVSGGWETTMAELTKQVGGLVQEVSGIKTRLDSINSRLSKVEAWEGRLAAVEQQLRERARSPVRRRSPSPGSKCISCGGEGHYRLECPRPPTVTFEDQFRCWECGEGGHSRASCPRSRSRSTSPKGQGN